METIDYAIGKSELGTVLVAVSELGVVAVLTGEDARQLRDRLGEQFTKARLQEGTAIALRGLKRILDHIETPSIEPDLPLDLRGTPFQQRVWREVMKIPVGETSTYKEIARNIGLPRSMRAVGNSCSNNPLAFAVPCHRVLRSDGTASGGPEGRQSLWVKRESHHRKK